MTERIRCADVVRIGFAYMDHVGLPWLAWPLPTVPHDDARWIGHVLDAVAGAPVCGRTRDRALAELRRIDNGGLRRALTRVTA